MRPTSVAGSILRGIYRNIVLLYDGEVRFDWAGSQKMRPAKLATSILRASYRKMMPLYAVEVRFGNTAQDEVGVSLVLGKYAFRFAGGWKSLLRDIGTEVATCSRKSGAIGSASCASVGLLRAW